MSKCKGKHHTSICDVKIDGQSSPPSLATPTNSHLNAGAPLFTPTSKTTTTVCANNSQIVLLQTAKAVIQKPDNTSKSVEVRLLLDGGSQKSYLSEKARNVLQLDACEKMYYRLLPLVHVQVKGRYAPSSMCSCV